MKAKQITSLSLKLAGIYSIITAIPLLKVFTEYSMMKRTMSGFMREMGSAGNSPNEIYLLIGALLPFVLLIGLGVYLIKNSNAIAGKIGDNDDDDDDDDAHENVTAKEMQSIALSIVGVVFVIIAIPKLVQSGINIQAQKSVANGMMSGNIASSTWAYIVGLIVQTVVGSALFLGSNGLASLWESFQKSRAMGDVKDT